jgi:hypothetical protein
MCENIHNCRHNKSICNSTTDKAQGINYVQYRLGHNLALAARLPEIQTKIQHFNKNQFFNSNFNQNNSPNTSYNSPLTPIGPFISQSFITPTTSLSTSPIDTSGNTMIGQSPNFEKNNQSNLLLSPRFTKFVPKKTVISTQDNESLLKQGVLRVHRPTTINSTPTKNSKFILNKSNKFEEKNQFNSIVDFDLQNLEQNNNNNNNNNNTNFFENLETQHTHQDLSKIAPDLSLYDIFNNLGTSSVISPRVATLNPQETEKLKKKLKIQRKSTLFSPSKLTSSLRYSSITPNTTITPVRKIRFLNTQIEQTERDRSVVAGRPLSIHPDDIGNETHSTTDSSDLSDSTDDFEQFGNFDQNNDNIDQNNEKDLNNYENNKISQNSITAIQSARFSDMGEGEMSPIPVVDRDGYIIQDSAQTSPRNDDQNDQNDQKNSIFDRKGTPIRVNVYENNDTDDNSVIGFDLGDGSEEDVEQWGEFEEKNQQNDQNQQSDQNDDEKSENEENNEESGEESGEESDEVQNRRRNTMSDDDMINEPKLTPAQRRSVDELIRICNENAFDESFDLIYSGNKKDDKKDEKDEKDENLNNFDEKIDEKFSDSSDHDDSLDNIDNLPPMPLSSPIRTRNRSRAGLASPIVSGTKPGVRVAGQIANRFDSNGINTTKQRPIVLQQLDDDINKIFNNIDDKDNDIDEFKDGFFADDNNNNNKNQKIKNDEKNKEKITPKNKKKKESENSSTYLGSMRKSIGSFFSYFSPSKSAPVTNTQQSTSSDGDSDEDDEIDDLDHSYDYQNGVKNQISISNSPKSNNTHDNASSSGANYDSRPQSPSTRSVIAQLMSPTVNGGSVVAKRIVLRDQNGDIMQETGSFAFPDDLSDVEPTNELDIVGSFEGDGFMGEFDQSFDDKNNEQNIEQNEDVFDAEDELDTSSNLHYRSEIVTTATDQEFIPCNDEKNREEIKNENEFENDENLRFEIEQKKQADFLALEREQEIEDQRIADELKEQEKRDELNRLEEIRLKLELEEKEKLEFDKNEKIRLENENFNKNILNSPRKLRHESFIIDQQAFSMDDPIDEVELPSQRISSPLKKSVVKKTEKKIIAPRKTQQEDKVQKIIKQTTTTTKVVEKIIDQNGNEISTDYLTSPIRPNQPKPTATPSSKRTSLFGAVFNFFGSNIGAEIDQDKNDQNDQNNKNGKIYSSPIHSPKSPTILHTPTQSPRKYNHIDESDWEDDNHVPLLPPPVQMDFEKIKKNTKSTKNTKIAQNESNNIKNTTKRTFSEILPITSSLSPPSSPVGDLMRHPGAHFEQILDMVSFDASDAIIRHEAKKARTVNTRSRAKTKIDKFDEQIGKNDQNNDNNEPVVRRSTRIRSNSTPVDPIDNVKAVRTRVAKKIESETILEEEEKSDDEKSEKKKKITKKLTKSVAKKVDNDDNNVDIDESEKIEAGNDGKKTKITKKAEQTEKSAEKVSKSEVDNDIVEAPVVSTRGRRKAAVVTVVDDNDEENVKKTSKTTKKSTKKVEQIDEKIEEKIDKVEVEISAPKRRGRVPKQVDEVVVTKKSTTKKVVAAVSDNDDENDHDDRGITTSAHNDVNAKPITKSTRKKTVSISEDNIDKNNDEEEIKKPAPKSRAKKAPVMVNEENIDNTDVIIEKPKRGRKKAVVSDDVDVIDELDVVVKPKRAKAASTASKSNKMVDLDDGEPVVAVKKSRVTKK